jgi:hypothetical protein
VEPVNHAGAPEKPLVSAYKSEDEVSPKAGVAGSNPAGGTAHHPGQSRGGEGRDVPRFTVILWGVVVAECASVAEVAALVPVEFLREEDEAPPVGS